MKKAIVFIVVFVMLSVAQRLTGIGAQPQLNCQLRNTFQMRTSVKRNRDSIFNTDNDLTPAVPNKFITAGLGILEGTLKKLHGGRNLFGLPDTSATPQRMLSNVSNQLCLGFKAATTHQKTDVHINGTVTKQTYQDNTKTDELQNLRQELGNTHHHVHTKSD